MRLTLKSKLSLSVGYASQKEVPIRSRVRTWVRAAMDNRDGVIGIRFVDEEEGRQINLRYCNKNKATNVLSFLYDEMDGIYGDIVVCAPIVHQEANQFELSVTDRYTHIIIHGVLHLLGFRHSTPKETEIMQNKERQLLSRFGILKVIFE